MLERGRADDTPEAIARRLELYAEETAPLLEYFGGCGRLVTIDGLGTEPEVQERIVAAIDESR